MKTGIVSSIRKMRIVVLICIFFSSAGVMAYSEEKAGTLIGYMAIPDIVQTLNQIDKIAGAIDPSQFKPGAIKGQLGMLIGDPKFENIDRKNPLVIMVFYKPSVAQIPETGKDNFSYAVFIPAKDKARYQKVFESLNMMCAVKNDLLIVSNKKPPLASAQGEMDLYRKISVQKSKSDIRLLVKIDRVMTLFDKEIGMFVNQMQTMQNAEYDNPEQKKQMESFMSLGKLFMYGLLDMAAQSKDYQLDITLNEKMVLFSSEHSTIPGSALNRFYDGKAPEVNRCLALLPERGDLTYAGYFDMQRFKALIDSFIAGAVKRDPSIEKSIDKTLVEEYKNFLDYYLGQFALVYGFDKDIKFQMHLAANTDKSDSELLAMNEKFISIYNEAIKKLGPETAGLSTYVIKKNVRKSSGFDVHRYIFKMDYSKMMEEEKKSFHKMFGEEFSVEYAVSNGYVVASTNPKMLDKIIINTNSGGTTIELVAMKAFGPGMDSYIDFDIISFFEKIAAMDNSIKGNQQNSGLDETMKILKKINPEDRVIVASTKYSGGTSFNKYQVSMKMITDIAKFASEQMKAQKTTDQPVYVPEEHGSEE